MMVPEIGSTCNFTFTARFVSLNGIYTLTHTTQFETAVADKVDFVESLYEPAGLAATDYDADWTGYKGKTILRLVKVDDPEVVLYVPLPLIDLVPDPMIVKVHDLYLAIDLGLFKDEQSIAWMVERLDDLAATVTGTTNTTNIFRTDTVWMTQAAYDAMEADRQIRISAIDSNAKTIIDQKAEIDRLKTLVANYETTLIALNSA